MEQNKSNSEIKSVYSFEECHKLLESGNLEKVSELIDNGSNIYEFGYFEEIINGTTCTRIRTLFMEAVIFCNEGIACKLLDQYDRDLEVLKNTNFNKALLAMPDFQIPEFLSCCEYSISEDREFIEPVLLKNNNKEPTKLAFLNRKNRKALKFIHQLQRNGSCDLNIEFPHSDIFDLQNYLREALRFNKFKIAKRLFDSPFVDFKLKAEQSQKIYRYVKHNGNIADFKEYFVNFKFELRDLIFAFCNRNKENFMFIADSLTKSLNCSFKELLRMKCKNFNVIIIHELFKRIAWCLTELNLTFDDDDLIVENELGETSISFIFKYIYSDLEIIKNFLKNHPKLFEIKSRDNFHILHYAVECGNLELVKVFYDMCDDKMNFMKNEEAAIKSLGDTQNFFSNEFNEILDALEILTHGAAEIFLSKISTKILVKYIPTGFSYYFVKFFLSLPTKIDLNEIHDGQNVYMVICDHLFDAEFLEILVSYQDVMDWNVAGKAGKTLFMHACEVLQNKPDLIRSIIEKQPDCITKVSSDGSSCLHYCAAGSNETVKILIDAGADPKITNKKGEKAIASAINNPEVFSYLLQFESDNDLKDNCNETGETLLHQVANEETAKIILTRNVDFSITTNEGMTVFHKYLPLNIKELYIDHIITNKIDFDFTKQDNYENPVLFCMIQSWECSLFKKVIRNFKDQINFDVCDKLGKNFTHLIMELDGDNFKQYLEIVKEEILEIFLSKLKFDRDYPTENVLTVIELMKLEDLRNNFHRFVNNERILGKIFETHQNLMKFLENNKNYLMEIFRNCHNPVTFDVLLTKLRSNDLLDGNDQNENILHIICKKNDQEMINSILDFLSTEEIKKLSSIKFKGMTPFEMLNEDNKCIFGDCLIV